MRTMRQQGSFGQESCAYEKAPLGIRLYGIPTTRQNACNRFHTALYDHGNLHTRQRTSVGHGDGSDLEDRVTESGRACGVQQPVEGWNRATCAEHLRSLHEETHGYGARPLGSRILLAPGLLRTSKLRCSCQGHGRITDGKAHALRLYPSWCNSRTPDSSGEEESLHGAAHLSHSVSVLTFETDKRLNVAAGWPRQ